uniref:WD repeat-containing protein 55 homolog n=1 Tax=Photinus pyralis TaxID=7054 RepID=A0A1Y1LF25_PHOPY
MCQNKVLNLIIRLPDTEQFVASVSTNLEEICVWDIQTSNKVRTLKGITHPINLIPIDQAKCIVLCRRELKIYNLDSGTFITKLKGVMNQKMPYFGLNDQSHLVALSRNRMYVNLMNLETGDCVATFKVGEDRFLNSLLVSGDGRVLVCGDEVQKPFPLLVWNLTSKKLQYDLRIPHHDFNTSLAAITHEGNYVCCVCHEIDEPNPNFIVVYDLQSGTLFKKWKPSCSTVSLEISSQVSCVISGLVDARILVWDLITGKW